MHMHISIIYVVTAVSEAQDGQATMVRLEKKKRGESWIKSRVRQQTFLYDCSTDAPRTDSTAGKLTNTSISPPHNARKFPHWSIFRRPSVRQYL
jgi:hypothetical protein